jgi:protein involved in polysaccharide export with SLBB domain
MNRYTMLLCVLLFADVANCGQLKAQELAQSGLGNAQPPAAGVQKVLADYMLGPDDQITLIVPGLEDEYPHPSGSAEKMFRIDAIGDVTLPIIGRIHAGGLSTVALEQEAQVRLKANRFLSSVLSKIPELYNSRGEKPCSKCSQWPEDSNLRQAM